MYIADGTGRCSGMKTTQNQMLRGAISQLEALGAIRRCETPVDPKYELGAVLSHFRNEQPILFTNVKGSSVPVAGGLYGNRKLICNMLGVTGKERIPRLLDAIARPRQPRLAEYAPVQETVITSNIDLTRIFPVPTSHEKDSAPFLTAGMLVFKDPETGFMQTAVRRFQVNGGDSINVLVSPASPHLRAVLETCRANGRPLECAVILGYDASLLLSSQISSAKYGLDKYAVDSALRGEPLELVRCKTVDILVPSQAEIILEGVIAPGSVGPEGPFAELMGYYSTKADAPLMKITAITHRKQPIFHHCFPCREEHLAYGMIKEAETYAALSSVVDVQDVNYTLGGGCRLHVAVSIKKRSAGDGKSAILTVLGSYKDVKSVVVVDEDINIFDSMDLELALASRFQASRDLVLVPGALGSALEPSYFETGTVDKMGFDATKPLGATHSNYERAVIPGMNEGFSIQKYVLR